MGYPEVFAELRPLLSSIAYRMLGSVAEAEDVVSEAYLRWSRVQDTEVQSPKAFLSAVVTRLCIDQLRSTRVKRETYVGPWLPEPVLTGSQGSFEPSERAELADTLSMGFLILLESLTPVERAVFLLREVFGYEYSEVAEIVGRSEANCRQIALRARKHVEARRPRFEASEHARRQITERFLRACESGDLQGLLSFLSDDIVLWSDGGGRAQAARRPIVGAHSVARFLLGLIKRWHGRLQIDPAEINGQPGYLLVDKEPIGAVALDLGGDTEPRITGIRIVVNPDKLAGVARDRNPGPNEIAPGVATPR